MRGAEVKDRDLIASRSTLQTAHCQAAFISKSMGSDNTFDTADATEEEVGNRRMIEVVTSVLIDWQEVHDTDSFTATETWSSEMEEQDNSSFKM